MTNPKTVVVADTGRELVLDTHTLSRAQALTDARAHLVAQGKRAFAIDEALVDQPGRVVQAWWGGDELGFVGEQHPRAQPVTVVNLPGDMASTQVTVEASPRGTATTGGR